MKTFVFLALLCLVATSVLSACVGLSEAIEHYNAGMELQKQRRLQKAMAEYDEAIRLLNSELAQIYSSRGVAYCALGQHERAIQDFN